MNLTKRLLMAGTLGGSLLLTTCDKLNITGEGEVTVKKEDLGEIIGKVLWDYDHDGTYESARGVRVVLDAFVYDPNAEFSTETKSGGVFSFHDVPAGSYSVKAGIIVYNPYIPYWGSVGATVTKGGVTDVGEIKMEPDPGYYP